MATKIHDGTECAERSGVLEVDDSYYCITLKHQNNRVIDYRSDYDDFIFKHYPMLKIIHIAYEIDKSHKLHAHVLARGKAGLSFRNVRYWHTYIREDQRYEKWLHYCTKYAKNMDEQDQILLSHYSYHNNLFLEY